MNRITRFLLAAALLPFAQPLMAQRSGVIAYEVTAKTDPERVRFFQRGNDGGDAPEIPDVITFNQTFTFSNNNGKLTTQRPEIPGFNRQRPWADTSRMLAAEGSKRGFTAKSVNLQAVNDADLSAPADAQKISQEEMRNIRKQEMEKFHQRQPQN